MMYKSLTVCFAVVAVGVACCPSHAATATWANADLDIWVYDNASQPGAANAAPTWVNELTINQSTGQFEPFTASNPARLGTALFAFNSAAQITPGLATSRYQVNSVTFRATCEFAGGQTARYETTPVSQAQLLAEYASNNVNWQKPMELYGVGLRGGYTGYEFTNGSPGPPLLDEVAHPYASGSYAAYPVVGTSSPGVYEDVSNSVSGGFSATAAGGTTAPFTAIPWAIGTTNLAVGDAIPNDTTFTFTLDLNAPGVRSYVQQSLANGAFGVSLSSLHATTIGGGSGVYPRWYTSEAGSGIVHVPPASLPQLVIDYTILPEGVPGDYNSNGVVDAADYVLWRNGGPLANQIDDPSQVNAQDYVAWRARFGNTAGNGAGLVSGAVPEPTACGLFLAAFFGLFAGRRASRIYG
ncbi:MAG: hypothetical protein U0805_14855 [Pirellulales bacterium]